MAAYANFCMATFRERSIRRSGGPFQNVSRDSFASARPTNPPVNPTQSYGRRPTLPRADDPRPAST